MAFKQPAFWVGNFILAILFLENCCASCADSPRRKFNEGNPEFRIGVASGTGFRLERNAAPKRSSRSRSNVEMSPGSQANMTTEAALLLDFRKGVTQDPFDVLSDWNINNVSKYCNWRGVHCSRSPIGQQVSALNLSGYELSGSISPSLGGLQFLSSLDLSFNFFRGTIPTSIGNCSNLTLVDLSQNGIGGSIPSELMALSNLQELNLFNNSLAGILPPSLSNLSALTVLDVGGNQLQGGITSLAWGSFRQLEQLILWNNSFSGVIPDSLSNCSNMFFVELTGNYFTGSLPDTFATAFENLQKLQWLGLGANLFTGSIPASLGNLQSLIFLDLGDNNLIGSIPASLLNLSSLIHLYLDANQFTGPLPASLANWSSSLAELSVDNNQLTGELPADLGLLSQLQLLYIWGNNFTGTIPPSLCNCTNLEDLVSSSNFLIGEIPDRFGQLNNLVYLDLQGNDLSGGIPASLGNISSLVEIVLFSNQLAGEIPPELGLLKNLNKLLLSSNFLAGQIPTSIGNSTALIKFNLADNRLSGQIPATIGELTNLQGLNLSSNVLTGRIPAELSRCSQISVLDLSFNFLSGSLPNELNFTGLSNLYLNDNNFSGSIPATFVQKTIVTPSLIEMSLARNSLSGVLAGYDFGLLRNLQLSLDLSQNLFSGALPTGIGSLVDVQRINLSFNAFSGAIPSSFSQCIALQSLDLSSNNLDGQIPPSLATLDHLTYFNVSFNNLTGPIPNSGSFVNITSASFLGNPNLCGPLLAHNCSSGGISSCHGIHCRRIRLIIIPTVVGIASVLALVLAIWFLFITLRRSSRGGNTLALPDMLSRSQNGFHDLLGYHPSTGRDYPSKQIWDTAVLQTIQDQTRENVIGKGARSIIYKGTLPGGEVFVAKVLPAEDHNIVDLNFDGADDLSNENRTSEILKEAEFLAQLRHRNILKCLGLYSGLGRKALILEYMSEGNLHKHLHELESCQLTWQTRLKVAMGVAEGMKYLHHEFPEPIIHRDLKPSNILLDADFDPKVGDFGISKLVGGQSDGKASASTLCGTIGYMPPEYASQPWVSTNGDVYSYGMVLIELVTRKQPCSTEASSLEDPENDLRGWVMKHFDERPLELLDPSLIRECNLDDVAKEQMMLLLKLGMVCTREESRSRPSMIDVVEILTQIVNVGVQPVARRTLEELANDSEQSTMSSEEFSSIQSF